MIKRKRILYALLFCLLLMGCLGSISASAEDETYQLTLDGNWMSSAELPNTYRSTIVSHNYTFTLSQASVVTFTSQRGSLENARYYVEKDGTTYLQGYLANGLDDSITAAFNPGTYTLRIATTTYFKYSGTYQVKASATALDMTEMEPNDTAAASMSLSMGETVNGVMSIVDDTKDWYTFTVTSASKVSITTTLYQGTLSFIVYGSDLQKVHEDAFWYNMDATSISPSTETVTFDLEPGQYYISYYNNQSDNLKNLAVYSVQWSRTASVTSITVSGSSSVKVGSSTTLTANVLPTDATNSTVNWSSSNTSIAVVDSNGKVTGISEAV